MPESVPKESKETKEVKDEAKAKAKTASPRRRPAGNTVKCNVELLDGSTMDLDVEVSSQHEFTIHLGPSTLETGTE